MRLLSALLLLTLAGPASAALPDLTPFVATYRITVNGIPAGTAATASLRPLADSRFELNFHVQNRFLSHDERSRFDWHDCRPVAREYRHDFHGLGIDRQSAIDFDWTRGIAVESRNATRSELAITGDVFDGLSMAMRARCLLRDGTRELSFQILYRGERKPVDFSVTGEEDVDTALGRVRAVVVERRYPQRLRRTRVWVAPEFDWLMVRFEHVENPAARGSLLLTGLAVGDAAVRAQAQAARDVPREARRKRKDETRAAGPKEETK